MPERLEFQLFTAETQAVKTFDCGNADLNDFLCKNEVRGFEAKLLGKTTLVYYEGELVAYYTIYNDSLRKDYLTKIKSFEPSVQHIENIPALTIGRLAVQNEWKGKGIGRLLIQRIAFTALLESKRTTGVRLLLVQAKEEAFDFYLKLCFQFVYDSAREKKRFKARGTRTMFFDLRSLSYLL